MYLFGQKRYFSSSNWAESVDNYTNEENNKYLAEFSRRV